MVLTKDVVFYGERPDKSVRPKDSVLIAERTPSNGNFIMLFYPHREGQSSNYLEFHYDDPKGDFEFGSKESLYVHGNAMNVFYSRYSSIFRNGEYANGKKGVVDMNGPNFYPPEEIVLIIKRLRERSSYDDQILLKWLEYVEPGDGFWILGM